jgi:tetrahydromethanopterin S-methyltransferase subunit G
MSDLQPADFDRADYRTVLRRLTGLDEKATGLRQEARRWFTDRAAAADAAVREASAEMEAAEHAIRAAQRDLEQVDARAAGLWSDFVHRIGPAAERFGRTLPPASIPRQRGDETDRAATDYLDEVENRVRYTPPARPITFGTKILFGILGFVGGLVGFFGNLAVRSSGVAAGGDWQQAAPVVALLVMLCCPILAVVSAKLIADRRGVGLDTSAVVTVLGTGLATAVLLFASVMLARSA